MKKLLTSLLVITVLLSVSGCGKDSASASQSVIKQSIAKEESGTPAPFNEYTLEYEDPDGFSYEVTCRISPWILLSNKGVLNATWKSISDDELPGIDDWGFFKSQETYCFSEYGTLSFNAKVDDLYYSLGTIEIKNTTKGFDFTPDRVGYPQIQIVKDAFVDYGGKLITRIYGAEKETTSAIGINFKSKMTSNNFGPIPFIIAFAEKYSPNSPEGENYELVETLPFSLIHSEAYNSDVIRMTIPHLE